MANPSPTFEKDFDALRRKLRLSKLSEESDGHGLLLEALRAVRIGFIRELTKSQVDTVAGYVLTETPSTDEEVLKLTGAATEVLWLRHELLGTMTVKLKEGQADDDVWNEEGAFRHMSASAIEKNRGVLWSTIKANLDLLRGDTSVGNESSVRASSLGGLPEDTTPPGGSAGIVI